MKTIVLTDAEAKMFSDLTERAFTEFAGHGCSDFDLARYGFSLEEMRALAREYHERNGDPEEAEPTALSDKALPRALGDFQLLLLLKWRLET